MTRAGRRMVLSPRSGSGGGRVLVRPSGVILRQAGAASGGRSLTFLCNLVLLGMLPMFAQCFHYMVDIPPLYLLSKGWPFLMVPATIWGLASLEVPGRLLLLTMLVWLLAVTPLISIVHLGNSFPDAMATTIKVWPFTYVFALAAILAWLRPDRAVLRAQIIGLGITTFVVMSVLWVVVPASSYGGSHLDTKLFMTDVERGYRIYMPMFFGILLILYLNRSMWARFAWWKPVAIVVCFVLLQTIYKQRTAIAGAALAVVIGGLLSLRRWRIAGFALFGAVGMAGLFYLATRSQVVTQLQGNLGNSLAVREVSVVTAWNYLAADPLRWVLGVGGTTRLGEVTLGELFNNRMFFLADIGWLGVLFEYGLVGVGLMLMVHGIGLYYALKWGRTDDPLTQAFADYIIYLLAVSIVYSVVFTPGELVTIMAFTFYFGRLTRKAEPVYGIAPSQPVRAMPRHSAPARPVPSGL